MVFKVSQKVIDILERTVLNVFACELPSKSWSSLGITQMSLG